MSKSNTTHNGYEAQTAAVQNSVAKAKPSNQTISHYFVDYGTFISFPQARAYLDFPAGVYYPIIERDTGVLALKRIDFLGERAAHGSVQTEFKERFGGSEDDKFLAELAAVLNEEPEFKRHHSQFKSSRKIKRIENNLHLEEGYFPMHEWNPGLKRTHQSITNFLANEELYVENNLGYKRSVLLYGEPGTGKSRYIDYISKKMIEEHDAVIIRLDQLQNINHVIEKGLIQLEAFLGDRLKVFVIEEFAAIINNSSRSDLLTFLDNNIIRNNVMFLMTSNQPERIPMPFIDRPSRVDVLEEVNANNDDGFIHAWYKHITGEELGVDAAGEEWYNESLSPAYLKELFLQSKLESITLTEAWEKLKSRRQTIQNRFEVRGRVGF